MSELGRELRSLVADAEDPRATRVESSAPPLLRDAVRAWREALLGLAERLDRPGAVKPLGLATARTLLTDRMGPLYSRASARSSGEAIWWVADGLQTCPPHDWQCPVLMKADPARVAWTCAICGASDDLAARPA